MSELLRPAARPVRRLDRLIAALDVAFRLTGSGETVVRGATLDSRRVVPGDLYIALPGTATHGARYAAAARDAGAVAVLTDGQGHDLLVEDGVISVAGSGGDLPVIVLDDPRARMGELAAELYGRPADALTMIGITGTNGKTTTAFCVEAALRATGRRVGVIGTIGFRLDGAALEGERTTVTTPESVDLHALLALMRERGADCVVMEVSSHALALHRVDGVRFDAAGFTNLGRDHLDFHKTMAAYFAAKASLFEPVRTACAVINVDDPYGVRLVEQVHHQGSVPVVTASARVRAEPPADWQVVDRSLRPDGGYDIIVDRSAAVSADRRGPLPVQVGMPGEFNVANAVLALALTTAVGADSVRAAEALATADVPGRMQRVWLGDDAPTVVVDFAHTPQAVAAALAALGDTVQVAGGRLVAVLGCGGDRDPDKRRPMGAAAARYADVVVVTDDNPRTEDPVLIRDEVLAGARAASDRRAEEIRDGGSRRDAIHGALASATSRDVIAVLGKGHEQGQQILDPEGRQVVLAFDDALVIGEEWLRLTGAQA